MCLLLCSKDMERWTWMNSQGYPIERSLIFIAHSQNFPTCSIFRRISKIWCQISSILIRVQNNFQHQCWGLRKGPATELLLVLELRSKPEGDIQKRLQVNLSQLGAQRLKTKGPGRGWTRLCTCTKRCKPIRPPQKNENLQVHHIHDGASWPALIAEIPSLFHQVTRCKVSHHDIVWDFGGNFAALKR